MQSAVETATCYNLLEPRRVLAGVWGTIADGLTVDTSENNSLVFVEQEVDSQLGQLNAPLPVLGESFSGIASGKDFLRAANSGLDSTLRGLDDIGKVSEILARQAIYDDLGPSGLNVLGDTAQDENSSVDLEDVLVTLGDDGSIIVEIGLYREFELTGYEFSLALPGVPFNVDSAVVDATIAFEYSTLRFGIAEGEAFLDTSIANELTFAIDATVDSAQVSGDLGFLQVKATDNGTTLTGSLAIDVTGSLETQLALSAPEFTGDAAVRFNVDVFMSVEESIDDPDSMLQPAVKSGFEADWSFINETDLSSLSDQFGDELEVRFVDVDLYLNAIAGDILRPAVDDIKSLTDPLEPVFDVLNQPVPLVSDVMEFIGLGDGEVSVLEMVSLMSGQFPMSGDAAALLAIINATAEVIEAVNFVEGLLNQNVIHLGSFTVGGDGSRFLGTDLRNLAPVDFATNPLATTALSVATANPFSESISDQLGSILPANVFNVFNPAETNDFFDISFPIFDSINNGSLVSELLLGKDHDLVRMTLDIDGLDDISLPSFPVFSLGIASIELVPGILQLAGRVGMGYDTFGFRQLIAGDNAQGMPAAEQSVRLLDGFYVDAGSNLSLSITSELAVVGNYFFLDIRGGSRIGLGITMEIGNDPNADLDGDSSKTRFLSYNEVSEVGDCILDIDGGLYAGLSFEAKIGVDIPFLGFVGVSFSESIGGNILSFDNDAFGCINPFAAPASAALADYDSATGVLELNVGDRANFRNHMEGETVEYLVISADPVNPDTHIQIAGLGILQTYPRPTKLVANAGSGDDSILVRSSVGDLEVVLRGGLGNDHLTYEGSGRASLFGDGQNDHLVGGSGTNILGGGWGDDLIQGGHAATSSNTIDGGDGDDELQGGNGANTFYGGLGNDNIVAGPNGDTIFAGAGYDNIVLGPGNDTAFGEGDSDTFNWIYDSESTNAAHVDFVDGGDFYEDVLNVHASDGDDLIYIYPQFSELSDAAVQVASLPGAPTINIGNMENVNTEGVEGADTTVVQHLYQTKVRNVGINAGDELSENSIGDATFLFGFDGASQPGFEVNESLSVGNFEASLTAECAEVTSLLVDGDLEDFDEFYDCEFFISGVTQVDFNLNINFGGDQNPFQKEVSFFVSNLVSLESEKHSGPQDQLLINSLAGDDTLVVDSVTGNTSIWTGEGYDEITVNVTELQYVHVVNKYVSNTYFAPVNIDAGPGRNFFHFDASEYRDIDGTPTARSSFILTEDQIWGDIHLKHGVNFFASEGSFIGIEFTANRFETNVSVRSTLPDLVTKLNVNDDQVWIGSNADFTGVQNGNLNAIQGEIFINAATIDSYFGITDIHVADQNVRRGNRNVRVSEAFGQVTFIENFAGLLDDALLYYTSNVGIGNVTIEGSDHPLWLERYFLFGAAGQQLEIRGNDGADHVTVYATDIPIELDLGNGNDRVTLGQEGDGLDLIANTITVNGSLGADDRLIMNDQDSQLGRRYDITDGLVYRDLDPILAFGRLEFVRLIGTELDDVGDFEQFDARSLSTTRKFRFEANGGTDLVRGPSLHDNFWNIHGLDKAVIDHRIAIDSAETMIGGEQDDTFRITSNGGVSGSLYGGINFNGYDTLDYTFRNEGIEVDLANFTATGVGEFVVFINEIIGSRGGFDVVYGPARPNVWDITGPNTGEVALPDGSLGVRFEAVEFVFGGSDIDLFSFDDGAFVTGGVFGTGDMGNAFDSLDLSRYTTDVVIDMMSGSVELAGEQMFIQQVEAASSGSGNDLIIGSNDSDVLYGNDGDDVIIGNEGNDFMDGGSGYDLLLGGYGADTLHGGGGYDLMIGGVTTLTTAELVLAHRYWRDDSTPFDYQERIDNLFAGTTGDIGGNVALNFSTIFSDFTTDIVYGEGGLDWYLSDILDSLEDLEEDEVVTYV